MCWPTRNYCHPTKGCAQEFSISNYSLVVVTWDDLLIIGVGALDQSGIDLGAIRTEAKVVLTTSNLDLLLGLNEALHLLECLWRYDQVVRRGSLIHRGYDDTGKTMAIRRHHP